MYAVSSSVASGHAQRSQRSRISRAIIVPRSFRLVEDFPTDQHPSNFRSSCADLIQLRVAPQPAGGELVDVAVATQSLDRLAGHPGGLLGGIEYRARRVLARHLTSVACLADRVHVR